MSTAAGQLAAQGRVPWYLVEIETAKRCSLTYASAPCTAVDAGDGARCYFSYHTCQDTANFAATAQTWRFCSEGLAPPRVILEAYSQLYPIVRSVGAVSQKVDLEAGFSSTEKLKIEMMDLGGRSAAGTQLADCPPFDLDKSPRNTGRAGTFWRRWLAQWPHYRNMIVRVRRGFVTSTFPTSELTTIWIGKLEEVTVEHDGRVTLHAVDLMRALEKELPPTTSTSNILASAVTRTGTTLTVADASEYSDPAATTGAVYVRATTVYGNKEIMEVTARDTGADTLTVTRGQFGTTAEPIEADTYIQEIVAWKDARPLDVVEDIFDRLGVSLSYVDTSQFDTEAQFIGPVTVERIVTEPTEARVLVQELLEPFMAALVQGEDLKVQVILNTPARIGETVATVTEAANIIDKPGPRRQQSDRQRLTHCTVYYGFPEDSDDIKEAEGAVLAINNAGFVSTYYGSTREDMQGKTIKAKWLRADDGYTAAVCAVKWAMTLAAAPTQLTWTAELNDQSMQVGDLVDVTCQALQDAHGAATSTRCIIVSKTPIGMHGFTFVGQAIGHSAASKWGFIAAAGAANWGAASAAEKLRCYIGNASNVMSDATVGYLVI